MLPRLRASPGPPWRARVRGDAFSCSSAMHSTWLSQVQGACPADWAAARQRRPAARRARFGFPSRLVVRSAPVIHAVFFLFLLLFFLTLSGVELREQQPRRDPAVGAAAKRT